jgi:hypothetical protein
LDWHYWCHKVERNRVDVTKLMRMN